VTDSEGGQAWARVTAVTGAWVTWEAPEECATGWARVRLIREGEPETEAGWVLLERAAPALFTLEGSSGGAVLGWVRYRDGTVRALSTCDGSGCRGEAVDGAAAEELGLAGSGFRFGEGVWVRIGGKGAEVRGVERAEYPGLDWVRVGWPTGVGAGEAVVEAGVGERVGNGARVGVR
jgi:hypothetical protein